MSRPSQSRHRIATTPLLQTQVGLVRYMPRPSVCISMGGASSEKISAIFSGSSGSGSESLAIMVVALTRLPSSVRLEMETEVTPLQGEWIWRLGTILAFFLLCLVDIWREESKTSRERSSESNRVGRIWPSSCYVS